VRHDRSELSYCRADDRQAETRTHARGRLESQRLEPKVGSTTTESRPVNTA
jgi:hypothetical protein